MEVIRYDWSWLANRDISNQYTVAVTNKFDDLQEISESDTPNDEYENLFTAYIEASAYQPNQEPNSSTGVNGREKRGNKVFLLNKINPTRA